MIPGVLLVFVDGVGTGPADPSVNPLLRAGTPTLEELAGGPLTGEAGRTGPLRGRPLGGLAGLDARLGIPGTPASGTGHAALITGHNAARIHGRHFGPWVPVALRKRLAARNLFRQAREAGHAIRFANAYPEPLAHLPPRFEPGITLAARQEGLLTRHGEALVRGKAVAGSLDHELWRSRAPEGTRAAASLPRVSPQEAGRTLARMAAAGGLTVFAHYDTDRAGHRGGLEGAVRAAEKLDRFVAGIVDALPRSVLLCIASDHGNLEDVTAGHTGNPAVLLTHGPGGRRLLDRARSITDVTPGILEALRYGVSSPGRNGQPSDGASPSGGGLSRREPEGCPGPTPRGSDAPPDSPRSATSDGRTHG